jgi:xanthine dehydrogenase iron-sulfur cluster and FAD-binding subunit A
VPFAQVQQAQVTTIEGLGGRHPLQRSFVEHGGAQCGICTPGMIMAAIALGPKPSLSKMQTGLAGNLCRCTGYSAIYRSIRAAGRAETANLRHFSKGRSAALSGPRAAGLKAPRYTQTKTALEVRTTAKSGAVRTFRSARKRR